MFVPCKSQETIVEIEAWNLIDEIEATKELKRQPIRYEVTLDFLWIMAVKQLIKAFN